MSESNERPVGLYVYLRDAGLNADAAHHLDKSIETLAAKVDTLRGEMKEMFKDVATKADIESLRAATKADIESLRAATKADIEGLRAATKADIESLRAATKADIKEASAAVRKDMDAAIDGLRKETQAEFKALEAKVDALGSSLLVKLLGGVAVLLTIAHYLLR